MENEIITIYHNPRCRKSRAGLEFLTEKKCELQIIQYLKDEPFNVESLKNLLVKLGKKPSEIVRTQEEYYKTELKGKSFIDEEWLQILVDNPNLIKRPVIVKGSKAVIGDPAGEINKLF